MGQPQMLTNFFFQFWHKTAVVWQCNTQIQDAGQKKCSGHDASRLARHEEHEGTCCGARESEDGQTHRKNILVVMHQDLASLQVIGISSSITRVRNQK